jgi:hypothetical protein
METELPGEMDRLRTCLTMVASAILADVEPVHPARRKKRNPALNLVNMSVSAQRTFFTGRQDAGLYGRRDARRYIFRSPLTVSPPLQLGLSLTQSS